MFAGFILNIHILAEVGKMQTSYLKAKATEVSLDYGRDARLRSFASSCCAPYQLQ